MQVSFEYTGTGGELFGKMIVGAILSVITAGIYIPWFIVGLQKYVSEHTIVQGTGKGDLRLDFNGGGGELFVKLIIGEILTVLTLGIYLPWFLVGLHRFVVENITAKAEDGSTYSGQFDGTGGEFLKDILIGLILSAITFGIYMPWLMCKIQVLFSAHTHMVQDGERLGSFDFHGQGADLLVTYVVGILLTMVTFGIYQAWFQVKLITFFVNHTTFSAGDTKMAGDFVGEGFEFFKINLIGVILTSLTLGIYGFWFITNVIRWQTESTRWKAA